jgi:quinate dehydrogenase (quinone)
MSRPERSWPRRVFAFVLLLSGLILVIGGGRLASLGGSLYYIIAGLFFTAAAGQYFRGRPSGLSILLLALVGTYVWAFAEVGLSFWELVPRLVYPSILGLCGLLLSRALGIRCVKACYSFAALIGLILFGLLGFSFFPHGVNRSPTNSAVETLSPSAVSTQRADWPAFGRLPTGIRSSPANQITPANVGQLKVAWVFRTGRPIGEFSGDDENTPIQVGSTVYICTPMNVVFALDADTGKERWRYDPQASSPLWQRCRGVSYFASASPTETGPIACAARIVIGTIDARLIEIDAESGRPCEDFGLHGVVDLRDGMGQVDSGFYFQTSAPTVAKDLIVVGGWVWDNVKIDEPSGVVRAFDAKSGSLRWAWDLGNPEITKEPPPGQTYTLGTPNVWSTMAYDDQLGLVYLPTGNATPDFWGGKRRPFDDLYAASIVALDVSTGRERWHFQTVHHDVWDYDVSAQPALVDLPQERGGVLPALVQVTKRGQIFLLDRRTGTALANVVERVVPRGAAPGDKLAKTQPYSTGLPSVGTEPLSEAGMWGITLFDQLWCRISFKEHRYEGEFTPPGLTRSLYYPSPAGGFNWGSVSVDERTGMMFAADIRIPLSVQLFEQDEAARLEVHEASAGAYHGNRFRFMRQLGTPYAVEVNMFMSPLGVPCNKPPFGTVTAIDLKTRKLAWQIPAGTLMDAGPAGLKLHAPMPVGLPVMGGVISTTTGLVFVGATEDYYLRALRASDGTELWKGRLPVGSQATPMTYTSPKSRRQYVLISAGGWRYSPDKGDYVIAYALPN